ncbi:MAG: hypothetical protein R8G66_29245 [Cytophagales bacterium]|nr:hypothetical protein [Cytophagales bacterium]
MSDQVKPPVWYWIVSVVALLWNAAGVMNYLMQAYNKEAVVAAQPPEMQPYFENIPAWATAGFAIAVFGGLFGSVLLLIRKGPIQLLFIASLLGVFLQNTYWMFLSGIPKNAGTMALPLTVIVAGVLLILFSKKAKSEGWIA